MRSPRRRLTLAVALALTAAVPGSVSAAGSAGHLAGRAPPRAWGPSGVAGVVARSARAATSVPTFVQQVAAHTTAKTTLALTPGTSITTGDRLVVVVGVWSTAGATAAAVTDSAGNGYVELLHFKASDATEMSLWTAPITSGGGTRPVITVRPSATADVGAALSEYAGLSTVTDGSVLDQASQASGTTVAAATVSAPATAPTSSAGELALGAYVDSGFGDTLTSGSGFTQRSNISNTSDMELLTEDQTLTSAGATPRASVATGPSTVWLMATVVLRSGAAGSATAPGAPTNVVASPGNSSANLSWTAPVNGGSAITAYTVTPYIGTTAQAPTTVTGSPPSTTTTVTGLTNGTSYTFTVSATNAVGTGPASAASNAVTPSASGGGQWSSLSSWPMVAVHSVLLANGTVLQWDGWQQPEPTQVWNPQSQTFTTQTAPDSIFCSGVTELPDGRVLVVGGYGGLSTGQLGIVDTSIFDPATSRWTRVANMHYARWYPDLTELADGRYVAISGNSSDQSTWSDAPEVYDPSANTWTVLSKVSTSQVHEEEYPFSFLVPGGDVFTIGPSEDKSFLLDVGAQTWTQVGGASGVLNGSAVMYRPGKILYSGGTAQQTSSSPANANTAVIDLTTANPTWHQTAPMNDARVYHTLTMLADGTVLAVGGEPTWGQTGTSEVSGGVLPSEIWDPVTQSWSVVASTGATRGYHSTAILLPDATVLVAGSGHANPNYPGQSSAQIYSPPYLFRGARPTVASAPAAATYGATVNVATPDAASITAVNLVSLGADTHQADMDQHFVPLSFTQGSGGLNVQIPASASTAPPGNYMLFLVDSTGVPSTAAIINIAPTLSAPAAPTGVSATAGNASATVSWTAPANGGSPITSYTVTPYAAGIAQPSSTVSGTPPATGTTITGLTNGTTYTFTVAATNAAGTGPASAPSNAITPTATPPPAFVQSTSAHGLSVASLAATPGSGVTQGNRLVVETGVWSAAGAAVKSVTDSASDQYTELVHFKASDGTEMSVWSAPVTAATGSRPTITVTPTAKADVGLAALEYAGLSTVAGAGVVDQTATASGTTGSSNATVSSSPTAPTGTAGDLALGLYLDSGFGDTLTPGVGFTGRVNVSPTSDMELLVEDEPLAAAGATPSAAAGTGPHTVWLMATLTLKPAVTGGAAATRGGAGAAATRGGAGAAEPTPARLPSLERAARIDAAARARFVYQALLADLPASLLCRRPRSEATRGRSCRGFEAQPARSVHVTRRRLKVRRPATDHSRDCH